MGRDTEEGPCAAAAASSGCVSQLEAVAGRRFRQLPFFAAGDLQPKSWLDRTEASI
jgi:hypothetical protein